MKLRRKYIESHRRVAAVEVVADQAEKHERFDPRVDITESDWEAAMGVLREKKPTDDWFRYRSLASTMLMLDSSRRERVQLDEDCFTDEFRTMQEHKDAGEWEDYLAIALELVIMFPEHRDEITMNGKLIKQMQKNNERNQDPEKHVLAAILSCILFPQQEVIQMDVKKLQQLLDIIMPGMKEQPIDILGFIGLIKIAYPKVMEMISIPQEVITSVHSALEEARIDGPYRFINIALGLALLSADEVRTTNEGVELVFREPIGETSDLPVRSLVA